MPEFTTLETAVLTRICETYSEFGAILAQQISSAMVLERDNTGSGFFTRFAVRTTTALPADCPRILHATATVEGLDSPMIFLLFNEDGYVDCLEGATCGDVGTTDLDLSQLKALEIFTSSDERD